MTEAERVEQIRLTHNVAHALIEDLEYIREVLAKPSPRAAEFRRVSAQLRRLLVDEDLRKVAAPRVGPVSIESLDLNPVYRVAERVPFTFLSLGVGDVCGVAMTIVAAEPGSTATGFPGYAERMVPLKLDTFMSQRILLWQGQWINRREVIKYVANVAHGVHSTVKPTGAVDKLLDRLRYFGTVNTLAAEPHLTLNIRGPGDRTPIPRTKYTIDLALLHMMATARDVAASPDIIGLEKFILERG